MKRGRRILLAVAACAVITFVVVMAGPSEREPVYNGKSLSEWLWLHIKASGSTNVAEMEASSEAIRQIGTNALPWMMRWISSYEPGKLRLLAAKFRRPFNLIYFSAGWRSRNNALRGFRILGSVARPVVPQLADWATDTTQAHFERRVSALLALGEMGNDFLQIPTLVKQLADPEERWRDYATNELKRIAPGLLERTK